MELDIILTEFLPFKLSYFGSFLQRSYIQLLLQFLMESFKLCKHV